LTAIPGIGKKTAERLILELREKVSRTDGTAGIAPRASDDQRTQALMALTSLGYSKVIAEKALQSVFSESSASNLTLEEIIKRALRHTTAQ
jgi:Holliday junction DNA helicase RuvA